jgi:hypothetical protein
MIAKIAVLPLMLSGLVISPAAQAGEPSPLRQSFSRSAISVPRSGQLSIVLRKAFSGIGSKGTYTYGGCLAINEVVS